MKKMVSAGIIFHDGKKFLACKPTGQDRWDIPKGRVEEKEDHYTAALRETFEETGIENINKNKIMDMGIRPYNKEKDIHIYIYYGNLDFIKINECRCDSLFENKEGQMIQEVEAYMFVPHNSFRRYFKGNMLRVINDIFEETNL